MPSGGTIDILIGAGLSGGCLIAFGYIGWRIYTRCGIRSRLHLYFECHRMMLRLVELEIYGDCPVVPQEMRSGSQRLGRGAAKHDGHPTDTNNDGSHCHRGKRSTP